MAKVTIVGAGLAGLLAACRFPNAEIIEASPSPTESHRALLRFRDESVSKLTGIPFRRVRVHKEVSYRGQIFHAQDRPPVSLINLYSRKVTGRIGSRSIADLSSVDRFVAPDTFYSILARRFYDRISYDQPLDASRIQRGGTIMSTIPLPAMLSILGDHAAGIDRRELESAFSFEKAPITVKRYKISRCDAFQTIYFPDPALRVYRASITGDTLIVEQLSELPPEQFCFNYTEDEEFDIICEAFGLSEPIDVTRESAVIVDQKYGKIVPLEAAARQAILHRLTTEFGVYSLGRFATWRNVLLDDVAKDIEVIANMMASDDYGRRLFIANK